MINTPSRTIFVEFSGNFVTIPGCTWLALSLVSYSLSCRFPRQLQALHSGTRNQVCPWWSQQNGRRYSLWRIWVWPNYYWGFEAGNWYVLPYSSVEIKTISSTFSCLAKRLQWLFQYFTYKRSWSFCWIDWQKQKQFDGSNAEQSGSKAKINSRRYERRKNFQRSVQYE